MPYSYWDIIDEGKRDAQRLLEMRHPVSNENKPLQVVKILKGKRAGLQYRDNSGCWVIRFLKPNLSEKQVERAANALAEILPAEATQENVRQKLSVWLQPPER